MYPRLSLNFPCITRITLNLNFWFACLGVLNAGVAGACPFSGIMEWVGKERRASCLSGVRQATSPGPWCKYLMWTEPSPRPSLLLREARAAPMLIAPELPLLFPFKQVSVLTDRAPQTPPVTFQAPQLSTPAEEECGVCKGEWESLVNILVGTLQLILLISTGGWLRVLGSVWIPSVR